MHTTLAYLAPGPLVERKTRTVDKDKDCRIVSTERIVMIEMVGYRLQIHDLDHVLLHPGYHYTSLLSP